jgi:hypothetical protein
MTGGFFHEAFSSNGSLDRSRGRSGRLFQKATNHTISSSEGCSREQYHKDDAGQADNITHTTNSHEGASCKVRAETLHHRWRLNLLLLIGASQRSPAMPGFVFKPQGVLKRNWHNTFQQPVS